MFGSGAEWGLGLHLVRVGWGYPPSVDLGCAFSDAAWPWGENGEMNGGSGRLGAGARVAWECHMGGLEVFFQAAQVQLSILFDSGR